MGKIALDEWLLSEASICNMNVGNSAFSPDLAFSEGIDFGNVRIGKQTGQSVIET